MQMLQGIIYSWISHEFNLFNFYAVQVMLPRLIRLLRLKGWNEKLKLEKDYLKCCRKSHFNYEWKSEIINSKCLQPTN